MNKLMEELFASVKFDKTVGDWRTMPETEPPEDGAESVDIADDENPNHDPKTGEFTTGGGSGGSGESKPLPRAVLKKSNAKVMYHGTPNDFTEFNPNDRGLIFVTPNKEFAKKWANGVHREGSNPRVLEVAVTADNTFDYHDKEHMQKVYSTLLKNTDYSTKLMPADLTSGDWKVLERAEVVKAVKDAGFDSMYIKENEKAEDDNLAVFSKEQLEIQNGSSKHHTDTPEFKKWFGKSKIVNEEGKPLVVYHGGAEGIEKFDLGKYQSARTGDWGKGVYFTPSAHMADSYRETASKETDTESNKLWAEYEAKAKELGTSPMMGTIDLGYADDPNNPKREKRAELDKYEARWRAARKDAGNGGQVYPVYLSIENPLVYHWEGMTDPFLAARAKERGHDGLIIKSDEGDIEEIVVFEAKQIKSAIGNHGKYSSKSDYITDENPNHSPETGQFTAGTSLYHVTHSKNAKSIQSKGLVTGRKKQWSKASSGEGYGTGGVYAFESKHDAIKWAAKMDWANHKDMGTGNIVLLEVKTADGDEWLVDTNDPLSQAGSKGKWLHKESAVPAAQISSVTPVTKEMIRSLVTGDEWNAAAHPRGQPENAGQFAKTAGIQRKQLNSGISGKTNKVLFEVAPDPNDKELSARWNKLDVHTRTVISSEVLDDVLPDVLDKLGDSKPLAVEKHVQYGGYLDDTNPSLSLVLDKSVTSAQASLLTRVLGSVLKQDSMARVSKKPFKGSTPMGAVVIRVPADMGYKAVESMYNKLRQSVTDGDGNPLVNGHTTDAGRMVILVDAGTEEAIHQQVFQALGEQYDVGHDTLNVEWPEKGEDDYGFATRQDKSGRGLPEAPLREWVDSVRTKAIAARLKRIEQHEASNG